MSKRNFELHDSYSSGVSTTRVVTRSQTCFNRIRCTPSALELFMDKSRHEIPNHPHLLDYLKGPYGSVPRTIITRSTGQYLQIDDKLDEGLRPYKDAQSAGKVPAIQAKSEDSGPEPDAGAQIPPEVNNAEDEKPEGKKELVEENEEKEQAMEVGTTAPIKMEEDEAPKTDEEQKPSPEENPQNVESAMEQDEVPGSSVDEQPSPKELPEVEETNLESPMEEDEVSGSNANEQPSPEVPEDLPGQEVQSDEKKIPEESSGETSEEGSEDAPVPSASKDRSRSRFSLVSRASETPMEQTDFNQFDYQDEEGEE